MFSPAAQAEAMMLLSRMCSRLLNGSAEIPTTDSRLVTYPSISSVTTFLVVGLRRRSEPRTLSGNAGVAAGGVDRDLELRLELGHLGLGDTPGRKALLPHRGLLGGEGGDTGFLACDGSTHGSNSGPVKAGEDQRQVRQVALGIDEQARGRPR